jgi:CHRD domain
VNTPSFSLAAFLRTNRCTQLCGFVVLAFVLTPTPVTSADAKAEIYHARLSPLGVTNATVETTTGIGKATATLSGNRLTIDGTFEGLTGAATAANVRRGPMGIPGPVVFDISVPKSSSGAINASIELTTDQLKDLREARMYLQIHSERAPDGSIRGWLLTPKR